MGAVYEAVHIETDRPCALKVLHAAALESADLRDRFRREARVTSRIRSEFIVDVLDAGIDESTGTPFLVMELLQGEELGKLQRRLGRFHPGEVVLYLSQVARALDKTHAASIVHRDLKPANLFLTHRDDGTPLVKILDFGIAKAIAQSETQATQSLGTPLFMAPEQLRGGGPITPAADIYALGMLAYVLLVGTPYWQEERTLAGDPIAFAMQTLGGPKESPVARGARQSVDLPPTFDAWFLTACHAEPSRRFASAGVAVTKLAEALGELAAMASHPTLPPAAASSPDLRGSLGRSMPSVLDPTPVQFHLSPHTGAEGLVTSATRYTGPATGTPRKLKLALAAVLVGIGALGAAAVALLRGEPTSPANAATTSNLAAPPHAKPTAAPSVSPPEQAPSPSPMESATASASPLTTQSPSTAAAGSPQAGSPKAASPQAGSPQAASPQSMRPPPTPATLPPMPPVAPAVPIHGRD